MTYFSEMIVMVLLVPVLSQIILPLIMLVGYGLMSMVKVLAIGRKAKQSLSQTDINEELQPATNL